MGSSLCAPYASPGELAARWRPLTAVESELAQTLLDDASQIIRERMPTIEAQLTAGAISRRTLTRIVCGMVKRAMVGGGADAVTQQAQTVGPFALSQSFANPLGNLYLGKDDLAALGLGGAGRAFTIDLLAGA
jgi:hypothetical protein